MNYIYKKKEKKNGNCIISIRDKWENALIEFEQKNNQIEIVINYRNEKTTKFSLPIETFEKVYEDYNRPERKLIILFENDHEVRKQYGLNTHRDSPSKQRFWGFMLK